MRKVPKAFASSSVTNRGRRVGVLLNPEPGCRVVVHAHLISSRRPCAMSDPWAVFLLVSPTRSSFVGIAPLAKNHSGAQTPLYGGTLPAQGRAAGWDLRGAAPSCGGVCAGCAVQLELRPRRSLAACGRAGARLPRSHGELVAAHRGSGACAGPCGSLAAFAVRSAAAAHTQRLVF